MALGLGYLHANRIVHGCVTTENMLLVDGVCGGGQHRLNVKIPDFGGVDHQMTAETALYMAPEVFVAAPRPYDDKCDVYSFGMCLWEVYCCEVPLGDVVWRGVEEVAAHVRRRSGLPRVPLCCPGDLATLMERCWDADPAARPGMDEVVSRLMMMEALDAGKDWGMKPDKTPGCLGFLFACGHGNRHYD